MKSIKKFFKFVAFGFVGFIVLGIIAGVTGGGGESTVPKDLAEKEAAVAPAPKEETNRPGISKAEFEKIQNGMTYEEVKAIIGSEGEVMSEVGAEGEQFHTIMYTWDGESGFGANANFTFQEDKLQAKAQFDLN